LGFAQDETIKDFDPRGIWPPLEIPTKNKSEKLIVIIFKKASFEDEERWLKLKTIEDIDTANVTIIEFIYPENCPKITTKRRTIIVDNFEITDYEVPAEMASSFHIILLMKPNIKTWVIDKIGEANFNKLTKHIPEISDQQAKKKTPDYYVFSDKNQFNNHFIYLITKSPQYQSLMRLEANFGDSLQQLRSQYKTIDSLSKIKNKSGFSLGYNYLPKKWSTGPNNLTSFCASQIEFKYRQSLIKNSPIMFSTGFGITNLNFQSQNNEKSIVLGYFSDQFGDLYKSELLNFTSNEVLEFKNYNLSIGFNYINPILLKTKEADSETFKKNHLRCKALKLSTYHGLQLDVNSKPELQKSEITISKNTQETRQYQVLNFDKTIQPTTPVIKFPGNLKSYYSGIVSFGLKAQVQHFSILSSFFYCKSSMLSNERYAPFQKQEDQIVYSPLLFTQNKFNIQSFGLNISIGYEIY
jgi:hypothetical protein